MAVQINVAANQAALTASIQAGVQAYNQRFAQNNPINLSINQRAFSQPLGRMTGDVKDFEAALAASNARVIAFGASTAVLGGVIRSFKELANVTIDVEKNLADINRVFGLTTSQLQKFSTDLFSVGKQTASSFDDASKAALEFSRQGLKAEEVLIRTKDALTLARVAGISTANSVDALTSTINGFAATGVTTTQILNKLVAVEQDFAVGAGDLAEALSRTGQAAQEAGVSLDQLNALVTAAQQSTARGGAVIGNALKTIFTRLQRTETLDQLEAFNIAVRDVQGNTLPAVSILQNFAGAYKGLADAQRAQLSEQVAGVYQVNILKAIVGDLNKSQGVYAGALQRGASATNEAEVATAKLNQTLDALLKQTATSTQQLANNIGKVTFEPLARYGTEQLKSLVESMNEILEGEGIGSTFANGLLKGIRNVIAGPGAIAAFFTLFKLIQNSFTYLAQALPQIAGITTETQNRKNIEQSILQIMQQQGPVSQALAGTMGNQAAQAQLLLQLARQQTAEYQMQSTLAKQLAVQLAGQGVRVKGSGGLQATRAGGYIPNATRMAEAVGAQAGGYAPGKVVKSPVGGVMNTAEDVKYVPGFAQPFINPPAGSKAGRAHRQNAISRTGVDPYIFSGFIPNFVNKKDQININRKMGRTFEARVGDDIGVPPSLTGAIDFKKILNIPDDISKGYYKNVYNKNTFADAHSGNGHDNATLIGKVIRHLNLNYNKIRSSPTEDFFLDSDSNIILDPDFVEIIGKGSDKEDFFSSKVSSLKTDSKSLFLQGLVKGQKEKISKKNISLGLFKDKVDVDTSFSKGFIPNFAIPVDSARIPWFKKYASSYKNTASDKDIFRQIDFPTYGKGLDHSYAKIGNPDMVSFLYEDFVRSAMNIALGSKQVVRSKEAGFKNTPTNAISNRDPIDLAKKLSGGKFRMLEVKQSKDNQKQTISQISDAKLRGLFEENPELAKNVELMSIIFNDPKYVDPTGKSPDGVLNPFEQSIAPIVKNSYANVDSTMRGKLGLLTDGLMRRYQSKKNSFSKGFVPNFAGKDIATKFFKTKTGPDLFSSKGTGLSGTVYRQPGYRSSGYQLKEQLNNMVMSILGNNVFFPDASSLNPKIYGDVNKGAENSAKTAALKLSSGGKTSSLGLGAGMMSEAFGNSRYVPDREAVFTGQVSGKMKRVNYDRLSDILGAFWSANPETKSAWESLKNTSETGKFEEKQNIRVKTSLLKKAYEDFLVKNNYIGTRVKLNSYRKRAEGVEGVNYGALRSDLAGVSNVRNIDKYGGFIPNFAYKQAVMGLEESMSGEKAVFDSKPFPHIRNKSQPTFSSAIADHGGLSNALSDSMRGQKNAGLMNKGYVPNFAAPQNNRDFDVVRFSSLISKSVDDFGKKLSNKIIMVRESILLGLDLMNTSFDPQKIERTAESTAKKIISSISNAGNVFNNSTKTSPVASQKSTAAQMAASFGNLPTKNSGLDKFSENLSKASTAIAIAGPILAGFAEQAIYGDRKRTEMSSNERFGQSALSTGLSSISTGAGIGAVFGPVGAAIGGLIGVTVGLTSAFSATKLSTEELMQLNQEQTQKAQANITAASSYVEAQKSLTQMISSGASSSDIEIAGKKLSDNFNEIKDVKLQEIFNATGGDVAAMSKQLQEYTNQVTKESAKQTGLYGANIKPQERASALSLGLGKEGSKDFVSKIRQGLSNIEIEKEKAFKVERAKYVGMSTDVVDYILKEDGIGESVQRKETEKLAASLVPENEPERETKIQELNKTLLNKNFEEVLKFIEKINLTSEAQKATDDFKQVATRSFNQIFLDMEKAIAKSAFDVALSFEKDSGSRRIQSAILDFSMNFEESLNSFISNNLPDARKFDFTAANAGQKAEMLLQKSQQDYNKAIAEQDNERASFLNKSSETLTEKFKTSFLPSQASAEFFQSQVLPQIQAGTFSGDAKSLSEQFKNVSFEKAQSKFSKTGLDGTLDKDNIVSDLNRVKNFMQVFIDANLTNEDQYKKLQEAQKALIDLQNQTALFENENGMTKMQNILDIAANEKVLFEQKQANAKKEAEINKQLTAVSIKANEEMAVQKAAVDKQNLMRLESMKNVSANIANNLEISKARSNAKINTLQGDLADPRLDYGSSAKEVTGRKIAIESQILKTQRAEEDAAISAEIQQRVLQMAAEQDNTNALYELTKAITDYMGNLLQQDLGGQEGIADIKGRVNEMGQYAQNDVDLKYGSGSFAKFEAYQRTQQSKTSANVIGKLDAAGFNETGKDGKLLMTQEDQLKTLTKMSEDYEKSGDVVAKGIVDRYKAEIINKKTSLAITRENIDEELKRKQILEQQSHILTERFKKGYSGMSAASDRMIEDLVERTPERFADGMTNALMEVAKGTKSIGDAFKDMAINFGQEMMQAVMRAAIGKMVGSSLTSLFGQAGGSVTSSKIGRQTGGVIHAQNGMYISGGRTGDKNLAMLEDGEYVLNREAVKSFGGVNNLDKMNYDMAPRFGKKMQGGGSVDLFAEMGINKKGENDYTGNLMSRSTNIGAINNSDYSAYAYAESDYFKKMQEKAIQDEQERVQKKFEKDQKNAQLISSIVGAVGSMFMAVGMAGMSADASSGKALAAGVTEKTVTGATPVVQKGLTEAAKQGPQALSQFAQKNAADILVKGQALNSLKTASEFARGISPDKLTGAFSKFSGGSQLGTILSEQGIQAAKKTAGSGILGNLFSTAVNTTGANVKKPRRQQTGGLIGFNNGGFVPYGSRLSDTIPALLTGGEYVMNNTAVKKYGLGKMNSMNAGAYQEGGSTASSSNNTNNNATSIAINIDKSGKSVYGANSSSYEKQDITFTKEMAQQINGIVLRSMSNEKRYGGELYKNSSRT